MSQRAAASGQSLPLWVSVSPPEGRGHLASWTQRGSVGPRGGREPALLPAPPARLILSNFLWAFLNIRVSDAILF